MSMPLAFNTMNEVILGIDSLFVWSCIETMNEVMLGIDSFVYRIFVGISLNLMT